jgi:hypothetical protein
MVHIIKRVKDYNDDMIETYMQLSNSNKENWLFPYFLL